MGIEVRQHNLWHGDSREEGTSTQDQGACDDGGCCTDVEASRPATEGERENVTDASSTQGNLAGNVHVCSIQLQNKGLTPNEEAKLEAFIKARSMAKAARELGIRTDTLRDSLRNIREKLGVECNADLFPEGVEYRRGMKAGAVTAGALLELLESQEHRCALSGVELTPDTAVVDHIQPRKYGGKHKMSNLQWLNCDVNRAKGTLSQAEFVALCRRVVAWNS